MFGQIGTVEINPKDNKVCDRLSLLELQKFIEQNLPEIAKFSSNANVYEIGILETYEKHKRGYIISEDAVEYEQKNPQAAQKIKEISEKAKQRRDFEWLGKIPKLEYMIQSDSVNSKGEEK